MNITKNTALAALLDQHIDALSAEEALEPSVIRDAIAKGTMVLLGNPAHPDVKPTLIGQPARVKVNANIGTSQFMNDPKLEMVKLKEAEKAGADAVMDLSTAGDLLGIRLKMLTGSGLPLGTVPIYSLTQKYIDRQEDPANFEAQELIDEIKLQAEQGVDFFTLHFGVTQRAVQLAMDNDRTTGIVSRGGSILGRWMNRRNEENPLLTNLDAILDICVEHNVTLSLGDGMRPGCGNDAGDAAQIEEVIVLGEVTRKAWEAGVQVMIEGPGHVPFNQVQAQMQSIKALTHNAPLYVLGPLTTDSAPGYDHIAGAIGGTLAAMSGADFLCYLTPAEHLTLPCVEDVRQGVMASRIAAHAAEVAMGKPQAVARDLELSKARKALDWDKMHELALDPDMLKLRRKDHAHERECAMCGKFCAMKMLEEEVL